jgi:hypothetical protein
LNALSIRIRVPGTLNNQNLEEKKNGFTWIIGVQWRLGVLPIALKLRGTLVEKLGY